MIEYEFGIQPTPYQAASIFCPERYSFIEGSTKSGKAQPVNRIVYTPRGPIRIGDIKVGDIVCTPFGTSRVIAVWPQGKKPCYRIEFSDGASTECADDHLWEVHYKRRNKPNVNHRIRSGEVFKRRKDIGKWPQILSVNDILKKSAKKRQRQWIRVCQPVDFANEKPLPLDPYFLGLLLGDGCLSGPSIAISTGDSEIRNYVAAILKKMYGDDYKMRGSKSNPYDHYLTLTKDWRLVNNRLIEILKKLGLRGTKSRTKFIPDDYLFNSAEVRREVLRGILDTDGWVDHRGQPCIVQTSKILAEQITWIVRSLGGCSKTSVGHNKFGAIYRTRITVSHSADFFRLTRKKRLCVNKKKSVKRTFRRITPIGEKECVCITLDDPRGLYLTDDFIVTHNSLACMLWLLQQAIRGVEFEQNGIKKVATEYWWVAPVYSQARLMYERMRRALPPENRETNETNMTISVKVGPPRGWATIHFKSGDRYDALYGAEVGACVIDEASRTREDVFFAVRSTLTATNGPLRAIGNVKGRKNWFYHQCRVAEQGSQDAKYARFTSDDAIKADIVKATEIEDAKRLLPEAVFRELYYAEPSDDGGNPFGLQHIAACVKPMSTKPPRCFGVDFGKHEDYTVVIGLDEDGCVCRFDRWKDMPWPETLSRVKAMCGHHKTLLDASGVGDPVVDQLQHDMGSSYQGFKFTWSSKQDLMTGLAVAIQSRKIGFPDGIIRQELDSFEYSVKTSEGRVTSVSMSAPPRCHDDCVASLGLAVSLFPRAITVWDRLGTPEEVKRFETAATDLERMAGRWRGLDGERGILQ